ncbi:diacylglycerol/polyprenol kinase family protein [Pseudanabaena sp. FACHB-2040]|uniref:diacylglycerol/polyprenol kinase family protein n=1 Tax=Pseudanabaena sp. FACHB-2040 TaxID=2692859 RepID=UPI001687AE48|nr:diacylglycerol/polyprenol kinase family protein [Pseudanabaena sp. FACHB-2040]MBD2258662.1 phosphatidate cytidylyltransferase [Pseudanabaena sp. FACHB-2040]
MPTPLLQVGLVVGWLAIVGGVAEGLRRTTAVGPEITRKVVHIGAGHVILLAWWLQTPAWMGIAASVAASAIALLSYRMPILPGINGVGRDSLGTFFYASSIGLLTAGFWPQGLPHYTAIGILVMTWGDGLAALVGQRFGRHPYKLWDTQKSWEGSLAMFIASLVVCLSILGGVYGWSLAIGLISFLVAVVATGLEAFSKFGIDNLTVPLGSAALAYWLNSLIS